MNGSYSSDHDLDNVDDSAKSEREISLGTSTVLGIFFALALVCSLFFGFGYTMGRRSAQTAVGVQEAVAATASSTSKPLSGSPVSSQSAGTVTNTDSPGNSKTVSLADNTGSGSDHSASSAAEGAAAGTPETQPASSPVATPAKLPAKESPVPIASASSAQTASGSVFVQIAAVSHREDADILVSTLTRRGYNVAIRQEPQDKLMHVQIGPFASKKDADAMRQRLLADGYNAIVK